MTEDEQEELKFPLEFQKCPYCKEERRIAWSVRDEEIAKGNMRSDRRVALGKYLVTLLDESKVRPFMTVPELTAYVDACAKCGGLYVVYCERKDVDLKPNINMPPGEPGFPGGFPFGRG